MYVCIFEWHKRMQIVINFIVEQFLQLYIQLEYIQVYTHIHTPICIHHMHVNIYVRIYIYVYTYIQKQPLVCRHLYFVAYLFVSQLVFITNSSRRIHTRTLSHLHSHSLCACVCLIIASAVAYTQTCQNRSIDVGAAATCTPSSTQHAAALLPPYRLAHLHAATASARLLYPNTCHCTKCKVFTDFFSLFSCMYIHIYIHMCRYVHAYIHAVHFYFLFFNIPLFFFSLSYFLYFRLLMSPHVNRGFITLTPAAPRSLPLSASLSLSVSHSPTCYHHLVDFVVLSGFVNTQQRANLVMALRQLVTVESQNIVA